MVEGEPDSGTPLFAIFVISLLSLFLIPFTIYKFCSAASHEEVVKPWEAADEKKKSSAKRFLSNLLTPSTIALLFGWIILFGLLWYVQHFAKDLAPFDPYDILKLERGASEQDVKKAYRRLSLQYHPDKNTDPAAVPIFLQVSQAYRALTDEVARKNWEQFGHPDGKQAMDIGIALPAWVMGDDRNGPIILAGLVILGIVLPLGAAAWFLFSSSKYMGPNQIMQETLSIFFRSKFAVKESQSLARIPDTLVQAHEFFMLPTPNEQAQALEELRRELLCSHGELKDKPQFFKRKASTVKVHMLLLAHMSRLNIPPVLHKDLDFVLRKSAVLLEEMIKIANIPRFTPYGWLTPTIGSLEMLQCLTQAVSMGARKTFTHGKTGGDSQASMLQLPNMDMDVLRRLGRKRVRGLTDLLELPESERLTCLQNAGMSNGQAHETVTALLSIPVVIVSSAEFLVEGEEGGSEVMEEDIVTCCVRLVLRRPAHRQAGFKRPKGSAVLAYAPHCPVPREERWYVILAHAANNVTLSYAPVSLLEAEALGVETARKEVLRKKQPEEAGTNGKHADKQAAEQLVEREEDTIPEAAAGAGQQVDLRFRAPRQGKYDLTLYVISDCWIGCDRIMPVKLKVNELTRAEREGRVRRGKAVPEDGEGDGAEVLPNGDASETEEDESDEGGEYDSEEGSTEESGSEAGDGPADDDSATSTEAPLLRDVDESEH